VRRYNMITQEAARFVWRPQGLLRLKNELRPCVDTDKRIEELESQVSKLTHELQKLRGARQPQAASPVPQTRVPEPAPSPKSDSPTSSSINPEARASTIWLSRLAVVFVTVAIILAAGKSASTSAFDPRSKALVAYGLAALMCLIGGAFPDRRSFLASIALGTGLAAGYFTTYAVFFIPNIQIFTDQWNALPILFIGIMAIAGIVAWRKSHVAAVMSYAVVYYTFGLAAHEAATVPQFAYSIGAIALAPATALLLHARFHWRFLVWLVLAGTYGPFIAFLYSQPAAIQAAPETYFWLTRGPLAIAFLAVGVSTIMEVRREDIRSRGVLLISLFNCALFFPIAWMGIERCYPDHAWLFRLTFTIVLALLALMAETRGSRRNYLFQAYIAQAFAMAVLSMMALYSGVTLWPALALACLALTVFYQQSGAVILKAGSILLLFAIFAGAAFTIKAPGYAVYKGYAVPANWLGCAAPALIFFLIAIYYERATRRRPPRKRHRSGHWFLADSLLDPPSATVAMLHSALGALLLMVLAITDRAQQPDLPYLLGALSIALAITGFLVSTPQLEVAAVLLLVAAHVSFHFFLLVDKSGFDQTGGYVYGTAILAVYTYLAGLSWERYLRRVGDDRAWEHNLIAPLPHIGATYMVATLIAGKFGEIYAPATYNAIAAILLIFALVLPFAGLKIAGFALLAIGAALFSNLLYDPSGRLLDDPSFLFYLVPFLCSYAISERALYFAHKRPAVAHRADDTLRTIIVATGGAMGLLAFNKWAGDEFLALYWLAHGLAGVGLSLVFREPRYRWAASLILVLAVLRALFTSPGDRVWLYQFGAFAGLGIAALIAMAIRERKPPKETSSPVTTGQNGPSLDE